MGQNLYDDARDGAYFGALVGALLTPLATEVTPVNLLLNMNISAFMYSAGYVGFCHSNSLLFKLEQRIERQELQERHYQKYKGLILN